MKVVKVLMLLKPGSASLVDGFDVEGTCFTLIPWTCAQGRSHFVPTMRSNGGAASSAIKTRTAAVAWCRWVWGKLPEGTQSVFMKGDPAEVLAHCKTKPYVQRVMRFARMKLCLMTAKEIEKAELPEDDRFCP